MVSGNCPKCRQALMNPVVCNFATGSVGEKVWIPDLDLEKADVKVLAPTADVVSPNHCIMLQGHIPTADILRILPFVFS